MLTRECADMKHRILPIWIVAACLGMASATASADIYLLVPGVAGDSIAKGHEGWIRVSSVDWGVNNNTTIGSATGGAGAGKAAGEKLSLTIPTGPWSRDLVNNLTKGTHYPQVVIDQTGIDGRPSYRVTISTLFLTKYHIDSTAKSQPEDEIEGVFGSFRAEFYAISADGKVTATPVGWNFVTNTAN
jgi:type VI protein secretion system component Hcp